MIDKQQQANTDYVKGMKYKDIAEKYDVSINTVKSWKKRYDWQREKGAPKNKKGCTQNKLGAHKKEIELKSSSSVVQRTSEVDTNIDIEQLFVMEYLRDFNATRAAIACGYSKKSAHNLGWRLVRKDEVQQEIKRQKEMMATELGADIQRVISELLKIAFADVTDLLTFGQKEVEVTGMFGPIKDEDGNVLTKIVNYVDLNESENIDGTVISQVKQSKDGVSVKLYDKLSAIKELGRYLDFMTEADKEKLNLVRANIDKVNLEIAKLKIEGEEVEVEDDGFVEAMDNAGKAVWGSVSHEEES